MIKPVLLWSDALILLLLWGVVALIWLARNNDTLREPWRRVMRSRAGANTALILAVYIGIGLLDSMHYVERLPDRPGQEAQYGGEVRSALDWLLTPLRENVEKTYSAPFATHLYAKETMKGPRGEEVRDFPRLRHGGAHLADPVRDFWPDVLTRGGLGMLGGLALWLLVAPASRRLLQPARSAEGEGSAEGAALFRPTYSLLAMLLLAGLLVALAPVYHVFGTDKVGQDVLYLSLKSVRTGLLIGSLTTLVMLPFALGLGIAAGYFGGRVDDVIQYLYTTLNSIPGVLLIAAAVLVVQVQIETHAELFDTAAARSDVRLLALCGILGVTGWTGLARLLRAEALKLRELEFVQAARAFGVGHGRILLRHLLPNVKIGRAHV